jgi:farnesyl-diphosphate farnesyltransferase
LDGVSKGDEFQLLQQFSKCQIIFSKLRPNSCTIIVDITKRMAFGMAEFVVKDMGQGTKDIMEYNHYCHFVPDLVGEGLSLLFAASGLEQLELATEIQLSHQMGLLLEKVNIICDYLEDYVDGRPWWPQSIWK